MKTTTDIARSAPTGMGGPLVGVVVDTAASPAPSSVGELLTVEVPNPAGGAQTYGPMVWAARGSLLPVAGDRAYIVRATSGEWFCPVWWPAAYTQP